MVVSTVPGPVVTAVVVVGNGGLVLVVGGGGGGGSGVARVVARVGAATGRVVIEVVEGSVSAAGAVELPGAPPVDCAVDSRGNTRAPVPVAPVRVAGVAVAG